MQKPPKYKLGFERRDQKGNKKRETKKVKKGTVKFNTKKKELISPFFYVDKERVTLL